MSDPQQPLTRRAARAASVESASVAGSPDTRQRVLVMIALGAVVFVLLCVGAVFVGKAAGSSHHTAAGPSAPTSTAPTRAVPANQLAAASIPTCSVSGQANAAPLKQLYGSVIDIASGKSLFARNDSIGEPPASGMKVLTAAAAISVLGPDYQITTQVVDAPQAGTIVLVGQGDATLSALAAGQSVYTGAPTLASLAAATMTGYNKAHDGVPITRVVLDSSYWDPNDNWDPTWPRSEQTGGFQSEVTALQVDGDRANPRLQTSPRGSDPIMTAGKAFVAALGLDPGTDIELGHAETGAPVLGSVQSQPVKTLVSQMLQKSDNTLGEMLARIVSVKENLGGSSSSLQTAVSTALDKFGVDTDGVTIKDGSGESNQDSVPAAFMSKFMGVVSQKENGLQYVAAGMPVAGKSGSLATRFQGANAIAKGQIFAKPGFIATAYSLSGYMTAKDGSALAFAFYGVGAGIGATANGALDTLATAVFSCGKNLSNN